MKTIRIFISSPGDVQYERNIARNTIREISDLYSKYLRLEVLMWEDLPLTSDSTFQDGIDFFLKDKPIDIAVFILWNRLGTPLSKKYKKADGSYYNSGTEYEYDMMMELHRRSPDGSPRILTYIKDDDSIPTVGSVNELADFLSQKELLKSFVQEHFRDDETNSNYAYLQFGEKVSFQSKFKAHLLNIVKSQVGEVDEIKEWEGNPYVGLNSFDFDQSSIFFGRRRLVYDTASRLFDINDMSNKKSLIVLGESGSGKSSFIKAGLLPFFCNNQEKQCNHVTVSPSQFGGKMYDGLLDILVSEFPFLADNPFISEIRNGAKQQDNFEHLKYALDHNKHDDFIIHLDQFEELFDESLFGNEERQKTIHLIAGIVSTGRIQVFISMRSDFYFWFSRDESLSKLKAMCLIVDLPSVDMSEITEIVEEPAKKANLKWEIDNNGNGLNKRIIADAALINELPLIEFALSELYEMRDGNDCLTFDAYNRIGGLNGAVINYADKFYHNLSEQEKSAFTDLMGYVIAESSSNPGCYIRKTSLLDDARKDNVSRILTDKLVTAHLFVTGKDASGRATVTIVHKILIRSWKVISDWVECERQFLRRNGYYEGLAQYWNEAGKNDRKLVSGRSPLLEAEYHLFKNENRLSADVRNYLESSIKKNARSGILWRILVFSFTILSMISFYVLVITSTWDEIYDRDFSEAAGFENVTWYNALAILICLLLLFAHSLYLKGKGLPTYKTVRFSISTWSIIGAIMVIDDLVYRITNDDFSTIIMADSVFYLPIIFALIYYINAYKRRKSWNTGFKPYAINDLSYVKIRAFSISVLVILGMLFIALIYTIAINGKEEKLKKREEIANTLFDGFDKIKNRLTYNDILYLSNKRIAFLDESYKKEIDDDEADDRDIDYAKCLLNRLEPNNACAKLHPDKNWRHHMLWLICKSKAGQCNDINNYLEEYINSGRYDSEAEYSTKDLFWIAEKAGRFDLAEIVVQTILDTLPDTANEYSFMINQGHISLSKGEISSAIKQYNKVISLAEDKETKQNIINSIQNDFFIFSRGRIISDSKMREIAQALGLKFQPSAIPINEQASNDKYLPKLYGEWKWEVPGGHITFKITEGVPYFTIDGYNAESGEIVFRTLSNVRLKELNNGDILWEELSLTDESHSLGRLIDVNDRYFELEVIDNTNPADKGQIRRYYKCEENSQ